ncbi:MAG: MFS transporter [Ignavibacteriae bacterium]|nr:MFS transporter [Ignavibacteriota bacterium]
MELKQHHKTAPEDRLPFIQKFGYGMGALVTIVAVNSLMNLTSLVYIDMLKMAPFLFGIAAAIPRVWDFVSDPIAGMLSDNTRSRFGRRIPYILLGGILVGVTFAAVFWVPNAEEYLVQTKTITSFNTFNNNNIQVDYKLIDNNIILSDVPELKLVEITNEKKNLESETSEITLFNVKEKEVKTFAWFEIAKEDGQYVQAHVKLDSGNILISSPKITSPQMVQLAWSMTPPTSEGRGKNDVFVYLLVMSLLFYTATTIYSVPHGALGFEMTPDYHERTRVFAYASFIGNVGAISSPWLYALARLEVFGNPIIGIRVVCAVMGLILIISAVICAVTCKERNFHKTKKQEQVGLIQSFKVTLKNKTFIKLVISFVFVIVGFQFVMGFSNFIMIYYVYLGDKDAASVLMGWNGTIWALTGLVGVLPMSWISTKIGKKQTVMFSFSLLAIGQLSKIVCYSQTYPWLSVIPTILLSWGMVMCFSLVNSMNADICDEDELNTGIRREGSYYAVYGWWWKASVSIAYIISGYLLELTGYNADLTQQMDSTLFWLRFWEIGLPTVLVIIAVLTISRYSLTENRVYEIKEILKSRSATNDAEVIE